MQTAYWDRVANAKRFAHPFNLQAFCARTSDLKN